MKCGEGFYLIHRPVNVTKVNVQKFHLMFLKNVGKANSIREPHASSSAEI